MVQLSWTGIGAAIATFMVVAALLWWFVPKFQMRSIVLGDPKARADIEDNFRKTVGQALGGIAVLFGAALAYLQFLQQQQTAAAQALKQEKTAVQQILEQHLASENSLKASQALLLSNQVAKGFEQLTNKESAVMRLGGIYALQGVMNASDTYHAPLLAALCAFVRESTKGTVPEGKPPADVQAALTVIAGGGGRDWTEVNLAGSRIPEANLVNGNLFAAELAGTNLSRAHLTIANMLGANLSNANLSDTDASQINLSHANLAGADLSRAFLLGAHLSANLTRALLSGADLTHADLADADLSDADCPTPP